MPINLLANSNIKLKLLKLIILLLFFPTIFFGQTLTGLWSGIMTNDSNTIRKDVSLEIALTEYRGKVYGYSCSEFIINDELYYVVKRVKGTINGDVCEVKDDEIISYNFHGKLDKGVKVTHTFRMNKQDSGWYLAGGWKTTTTTKYYSLSGKTDLKEEKDLTKSKVFPHLEELNLADDVVFYKEQKRLKEAVVQTTTSIGPDLAKNLVLPKSDIAIKNKPSLTSLENTDVKNNIPIEDNVVIQQKKIEGPVETTKAENKKPGLSINNTIETKKPTLTEPGHPFIDPDSYREKEITNVPTQTEPKKNETSSVVVRTDTKKINTPTNNSSNIKKNEPVIVSNNTSTQKNETILNPVQTTAKKTEPPITSIKPEANKTTINTISETPKVNSPANNIPDNKKSDAALSSAATFVAERKSQSTQTIFFRADSLELVLYDNGEIDGDTVSVLLNGEVIIANQCLKAVAFKKTIYISQGSNDSTVLVLYAENLGKYPPNTGLLIVRDGENSYPVRFTADLQTNAAVVLRKKKH